MHVRRRPADDAEHLGCCGLMLQCLAQFRVTLLEFFEQSDVFDRDHRLVSESFEKRYLFFSKWADFLSTNDNATDWNTFAKK